MTITDLVKGAVDWHNTINENFNTLKEFLTGVTTKTYSYGSNSTITVKKIGNLCQVYYSVSTSDTGTLATWTNKQIVTLDAEFKPALYQAQSSMVDRAEQEGLSVTIAPNGVMAINTRAGKITETSTSIKITGDFFYFTSEE